MRKIILMTSAAVIAPISAIAQTPTCTATPDCASLGYTEASCPNGGVKCPWGDKWFCTKTCSEMGFNYTCSGTGYAGGVGETCDGKYTSCTCSNPYTWNGTACTCPTTYQYACTGANQTGGSGTACGEKYTACKCTTGYLWNGSKCVIPVEFGQCNGYATNCAIGDILFSDGTCNANKVSGKTPIAVVVYKSSDGKCGQALALKSIGGYEWGGYGIDIPDLPNYSYKAGASQDVASCENSAIIRAQGDSSTYPAVWAAYNYTTKGTKVGDWCLPAAGIFTSYYNNQSKINTGFNNAGGTAFIKTTYAWSSCETGAYRAWYSYLGNSYGLSDSTSSSFDYANYYKERSYHVRPVIEF